MLQTVKQKIQWGTFFLFGLLLLLGGVGIFHIVRLKNDSQIILRNNYESLDYCHAMQRALDSLAVNRTASIKMFDTALSRQERNVTEHGEQEPTQWIRSHFEQLRKGGSSPELSHQIQGDVQIVLSLNMHAIEAKNQRAGNTASQALTYISLIASVILLVALTFSYNFPYIVTGPIEAFTKGIREVGAKNYHHRIHLDRKDEFGQMASAFNSMAERLEYFESSNLNQIIFEKTRAEAVINSLKDASIGIDGSGRVLFANDQALQLINMKTTEVVAMPITEIARKNDLFRFLIEEKGNTPFTVVVNDRENYFIKETTEIPNTPGNAKVIVLKNVTSFKELDTAKTNLIATISHELKTPLAASDFSIKLLEDERTGSLNKEQKEYVASLRDDNQRMLKILSELLNMAQIEAGKIQLDIRPVSPYQVADTAIASVGHAAKEKQIVIEKQYEPSLKQMAADADKTVWVLNNFLTNAVKYSRQGAVITVSVKASGDTVAFSVADSGPGIAQEYQSKVFNRFFKVPGSAGAGNGLGLAISKEFIDAQQGTIWVSSAPGAGAVFGFNLKKLTDQGEA